MEYTSQKRLLRLTQSVCRDFDERSIDMDVMLPDYCPDIAVVLKCMMRPAISHCYQNGDRISVEGTTTLRILYLTEERNTLQCYEVTQPFNSVFQAADTVHRELSVTPDYVNCRAIGPKRLDIHGAFRVHLHAVGCAELSTASPTQSADICCKLHTIPLPVPMMQADKSFSMSESFSINPKTDRLLYSDINVISYEHKALVNKMIVKGVLRIRMLNGIGDQIEELIEDVPFSQIIDIEGLRDEWKCRIRIAVCEHDSYLQTGDALSNTVTVSAKLLTSVYCCTMEEETVVLDAYSVNHPLMCEKATISTPTAFDECYRERYTSSFTVSLPDNAESIVDLWGDVRLDDAVQNDNQVQCNYLVYIIYRDSDGRLGYCERTADESFAVDDGCRLSLHVLGMKGMLSGNQLHVQADLEQEKTLDSVETMTLITDMAEDRQSPYNKGNVSIRIVYADNGDTVWNIAKEHHAFADRILAENDLVNDEIHAPTMLLIPV